MLDCVCSPTPRRQGVEEGDCFDSNVLGTRARFTGVVVMARVGQMLHIWQRPGAHFMGGGRRELRCWRLRRAEDEDAVRGAERGLI